MAFPSQEYSTGFSSYLARSVSVTTAANGAGRVANIAIPVAVITVCGANAATDRFFFVLAVAFYFYGILANAVAQTATPLLIDGTMAMGRKTALLAAMATASSVWIASLVVNHLFFQIEPLYLWALALMAGAGLANGMATGQWHARERFALPGIIWSFRLIPLFIWLASGAGTTSLPMLALGIGLADLLRCAVLVGGIEIKRQDTIKDATALAPSILVTYTTVVITALINGLNPIIDRMIASLSGAGGVSVLEAGERIYMMLAGISTLGIGTVLLTRLSKDAANGTLADSWPRILQFVGRWMAVWMAAGVLAGIWGLHWWLGSASGMLADQARASVWVYVYYLAGLPFFALVLVYVKRLQALQRWWVMVVTSCATVALNIPLSLALRHWMGIPGIALATTAIHLVNCVILIIAAHKIGTKPIQKQT